MPRELPGYREQLESVIDAFPDRECLNVLQVSSYTGIGRKTAARIFPFVGAVSYTHLTLPTIA